MRRYSSGWAGIHFRPLCSPHCRFYGRLPPVRAHQACPTALAVLAGAEHFSAAGIRYPPEVAIHNELYAIKYHIYFRDTFVFDRLIINNRQEQGQVIRWLDGSERFDITPMLINYERANKIRKHQNLPPLEPIGELAEESMEDISLEPAGTNTGMHQHHTYVTVN